MALWACLPTIPRDCGFDGTAGACGWAKSAQFRQRMREKPAHFVQPCSSSAPTRAATHGSRRAGPHPAVVAPRPRPSRAGEPARRTRRPPTGIPARQAVAVRPASGLAGHLTLNEEEHAVTDDSLSSHVHEMDFAPDPAFTAQANGTAAMYDAAAARPRGVLGRAGPHPHHVGEGLRARPRLGRRAVREVVRRRRSSTSPTTASTATSRPATATGSPSTSRVRPATPAPSPTPTCSARWRRPPTRSPSSASAPATPSPSTCR